LVVQPTAVAAAEHAMVGVEDTHMSEPVAAKVVPCVGQHSACAAAGHWMLGATGVTTTVSLQHAELPAMSVVVHVTTKPLLA